MLMGEVEKELDLLKRHLEILEITYKKGPIGMGEISEKTDIPKHKVRYSLRILEKENLIEPSKKGAIAKNIDSFINKFQEKIELESNKIQKMEEIIDTLKQNTS